MIYRIAKWLLFFALSPLLLLLYLAMWLVSIVLVLRDRLWKRRFRRSHEGRHFLVCTTRRGWNDFIRNNVGPVLPSSITICLMARKSLDPLSRDVLRAMSTSVRWYARPYLIRVKRLGIAVVPLHEILLPFKQHAKKSLEIQAQVAEIIRAVLTDLDTKQE